MSSLWDSLSHCNRRRGTGYTVGVVSNCRSTEFDCRPVGRFLDLAIDGRRISFSENAIYEYEAAKIRRLVGYR